MTWCPSHAPMVDRSIAQRLGRAFDSGPWAGYYPRVAVRASRGPTEVADGPRLRPILRGDRAHARPHDLARRAELAADAARARARAPSHRPLSRLQRSSHLPHDPDDHRHLRPARARL